MKALSQTNIRSVEITLNTDGAIDMIREFSKEFGDTMTVGAGTVTNLKQAKEAITAGARFILSPVVLSKEIMDLCKEYSVISVVGAMTPSEISKSFEDGADIVKVFPAISCGTRYFKDVKAPLGDLPLMAVGGVNKENAAEFLANGANYLGIGSGIFKKEDVENENLQGLVESIKEFEGKLN